MMLEAAALWLMFVMGVRHALDPDHIAVIDSIVFRTAATRPRLALWTGTLFACGHSLSVAVVALAMALAAKALAIPAWTGPLVDGVVVTLLLLVGSMNLRALLVRADYAPVGWRSALIPRPLRESTHPAAIIAIGVIFGLVFDTATQAAAWGAAATVRGGVPAVLAIAAAFAIGMVLADTLDSQIVGRLLRSADRAKGQVRRYRRAVGWLVVTLSFGSAALAMAEMLGRPLVLSETALTALGAGTALAIVTLLATARINAIRS
jgi:high-affinity nickel-transport protein